MNGRVVSQHFKQFLRNWRTWFVCVSGRPEKHRKKQDGHLNPDLFRISETLFQFVLWYILWNPCNSRRVTMHPCCSEWWHHLISHLPSTDGSLVFCLPSFSPILVQEAFLGCRSVINELAGTSTRATVALISLISFSEIKKKIVEFFSSAYNGKISLWGRKRIKKESRGSFFFSQRF